MSIKDFFFTKTFHSSQDQIAEMVRKVKELAIDNNNKGIQLRGDRFSRETTELKKSRYPTSGKEREL